MMPGDGEFLTAYAWSNTMQRLMVTQDDLDKLKIGAEVALVITELDYMDKGVTHHLRRCIWLQPPALPPGTWHLCTVFNESD